MPHIASTLTADNRYTEYRDGGADMPVDHMEVLVKGGIGVMDRRFVTPTGATLTEVSDEELAMLERNNLFKLHKSNGFVKILSKKADGDKVAGDMITRDNSAPLTPSHYKDKSDEPEDLTVNSGARA